MPSATARAGRDLLQRVTFSDLPGRIFLLTRCAACSCWPATQLQAICSKLSSPPEALMTAGPRDPWPLGPCRPLPSFYSPPRPRVLPWAVLQG